MWGRAVVTAALSLACAAPALAREQTENMTGARERQMANCPSAVPGASTRVINRGDGVAVVVTSDDPTAQQEIRRRARVQQKVAMQPERGAMEHTGTGTGSGKFGYCPGLVQNTRVQIEERPDGARLMVHAASSEGVRALQQQAHARAAALSR